MAERRPLVEGLKTAARSTRAVEEEFVYGGETESRLPHRELAAVTRGDATSAASR